MNITLKQAVELIAVRSDALTSAICAVCGVDAYNNPEKTLSQADADKIADHMDANHNYVAPAGDDIFGTPFSEYQPDANRAFDKSCDDAVTLFKLCGLYTPMKWVDA